jgi:UDP-N-acetylmuramyl pentapeptide synthase
VQAVPPPAVDIYAVTAPLLVEALQRLLDDRVRGHGALAPGQAFDAHDFLASLAPAGVAVTFEKAPMPAG